MTESHIAKNGKVKDKYVGAFNVFCTSRAVSSEVEREMQKAKLATIQEHFRQLIKNCRATNRTDMTGRGMTETYGDIEQTLDTVIGDIDTKNKFENAKSEAEKKQL